MRWLVHPKQSVRKLKPGDADSDSLIPASRIAFPSSAQEMREQDFDAAIKADEQRSWLQRGSVWPDQWVMRGNHHDGWVFGAADPLSGQVSEAKSGSLHQFGH